MKIAILGTRGIPNYHGGFEQFAEFLSEYLANKGHEVSVFNSHSHPFKEDSWKGVEIIHRWDPEDKIGTAGQFIYDLNCILKCRRRDFDIILQLGYTSSSVWGWLLPKRSIVVTNMDGLEWKRSKYNRPVRSFLRYAERLAVRTSDYLVADSQGIKDYLLEKYQIGSEFIAYGADLFDKPSEKILSQYQLSKQGYNMLIARLEPENNIEVILDGVVQSRSNFPFLVIGKHQTKFGNYLKNKFNSYKNIRFLGGIYNLEHLNNLRHYSNLYFHGHSVGGTNPSLLEAMASNCLIVAHDNVFNKSLLASNAHYFQSAEDIAHKMNLNKDDYLDFIEKNREKIMNELQWKFINKKYEDYFIELLDREKR